MAISEGIGQVETWQAEYAGHATPDGLQRLLAGCVWDADAVRDDVRDFVGERLGEPDGVLIVDDTGFIKKGITSAGVARQYTGTLGKAVCCGADTGPGVRDRAATGPGDGCPPAEIRRLLAALTSPPAARTVHAVLAWSAWRRQRQAVARRCHYQRRTRTRPNDHAPPYNQDEADDQHKHRTAAGLLGVLTSKMRTTERQRGAVLVVTGDWPDAHLRLHTDQPPGSVWATGPDI